MMGVYFDQATDLPLFARPAPSVRGSQTSAAAADSLDTPTLNRLERVVLEWLAQHGPATDEEIIAGTGLNPSTQRPRRIELVRRGIVTQAGEKRTSSGRKATSWRVA